MYAYTYVGDMWEFSDKSLDFADTAYTNLSLGLHTDLTYFDTPAGYYIYMCVCVCIYIVYTYIYIVYAYMYKIMCVYVCILC